MWDPCTPRESSSGPFCIWDMPPIIVRYRAFVSQWSAWFEGAPQTACTGDFSMDAVCRLLTDHGVPPGDVELQVDADLSGAKVATLIAQWQPPDLQFACAHCNGRGEYVGVLEREGCPRCGGRGIIRW